MLFADATAFLAGNDSEFMAISVVVVAPPDWSGVIGAIKNIKKNDLKQSKRDFAYGRAGRASAGFWTWVVITLILHLEG
jgi:hypothetical protein